MKDRPSCLLRECDRGLTRTRRPHLHPAGVAPGHMRHFMVQTEQDRDYPKNARSRAPSTNAISRIQIRTSRPIVSRAPVRASFEAAVHRPR